MHIHASSRLTAPLETVKSEVMHTGAIISMPHDPVRARLHEVPARRQVLQPVIERPHCHAFKQIPYRYGKYSQLYIHSTTVGGAMPTLSTSGVAQS